MRYVIFCYFIIIKHIVMSLAPRFRPTLQMSSFHATNSVKNYPMQVQQLPEHIDEQWLNPKLTSNTVGPQRKLTTQSESILRQHDTQVQVQNPFRQSDQNPFQQPNQQPFPPPMLNPFQQSIQKPYQESFQKPFQQPSQQHFQKPFLHPIQMQITMSNSQHEPTSQRIFYYSRKKKLRGNLRNRHRVSSSTRPPYPKGIRPDDSDEERSEYNMCDGNAVCQKHEWTTKAKNLKRAGVGSRQRQ